MSDGRFRDTDDRAGGWDDRDPPIGFRRDPAQSTLPTWLKPALLVMALVALVALLVLIAAFGVIVPELELFQD